MSLNQHQVAYRDPGGQRLVCTCGFVALGTAFYGTGIDEVDTWAAHLRERIAVESADDQIH